MARHSKPEPGEPGWKHKHVKGETDPRKIKEQLDAIEKAEQAERIRLANERIRRGY